MTLQNTRREHAAPLRCALCNRPIGDKAKRVPVFGVIGSTCYSKHAALVAIFEKDGLKSILDGPVTFEPIESEDAHGVSNWEFPPHIIAMRDRAERLGFRFLWHWSHLQGPATCELKLPVNDKRRIALTKKLGRLVAAA